MLRLNICGQKITLIGIFSLCLIFANYANAERIKDIASVQGVRSNQLVGYGLVVGLDGTGDQTNQAPFTAQSFSAMLKQFGITVPEGAKFQLKNVAAVAVNAELPAFAKPGQNIDITVSSLANAKSLRGGTLLLTPLRGVDGNVYALAQGNLVVGGFGVEGKDGSKITVNIPSAGRIPNGASVERTVPNQFSGGENIVLNLHTADFTNAKRVAQSINDLVGPNIAQAQDSVSISVQGPKNVNQRVEYLSLLENIEIQMADSPARIVINSRTGTIVVGKNVRVSPVAVTHGSLTVTVKEDVQVSQPNSLANGQTTVAPNSNVGITQDKSPMFKFSPGPTIEDIVKAVNQVGAAPGDLMAILEALKQSGALKAELVVI